MDRVRVQQEWRAWTSLGGFTTNKALLVGTVTASDQEAAIKLASKLPKAKNTHGRVWPDLWVEPKHRPTSEANRTRVRIRNGA